METGRLVKLELEMDGSFVAVHGEDKRGSIMVFCADNPALFDREGDWTSAILSSTR
jgi:hypothetical protein